MIIGNTNAVQQPVKNQDIRVTENGTYFADEHHTGLGNVEVNVKNTEVNLLDVEFTHNDTYEAPDQYTGFGKVTVDVPNGDDSFEASLVLSSVVNSGYKEESDDVINETLNILRNI